MNVTVVYGTDERTVSVEPGTVLGEAIIATGLPLEQPCAGRGSCLKCKVIAEGTLSPLDEKELEGLTRAEQASSYRLACRARVQGDVNVTLAPIVVYSNKMFAASDEYKRRNVPLGLAIDLGSTTVAAFLTMLDTGQVCLGAAALNQQTAFGADQQTTTTARTDFSELQMPFTITKGVFNTDGTRLVSPLMRIQANGSADLAKETLDFRVEPTFVATIQGQGDTVDRSGIMVPVLVSGSFAKPTFKPDMAAILNQKLPSKDQVQEEIKKLIPADKKERKKVLEEGVKNLLKGFGTN